MALVISVIQRYVTSIRLLSGYVKNELSEKSYFLEADVFSL